MKPIRLWHGLLALLALAGLVINLYVTVSAHPEIWPERLVRYLSFFTILTNMLVMMASFGIARGHGGLHRWACRTATRTAVSVYITVVAVIFQLLLAGLHPLSPIGWWGNLLAHQLVPAMWLIGWIVFGRHGGVARSAPLHWLVYPLAYAAWTFAHGAATGWYPYPFMDVGKRGLSTVALNMAMMTLFFAGLGFAYRWIDTLLGRGRSARLAPKA